ncbi:HAD family hydrolase [Myxococcaceae bacterium JPH2]|nr:HAD family hydrolase [Myxococcaceae bacterium JPH2]
MQSLLILDLDETLIHARETPLERDADFRVFDYFVYTGPHLAQFLAECSSLFRLAVWSSASDDYVREIVKRIIPSETRLEFTWGRSRCTFSLDRTRLEHDGYLDPSSHYAYAKKLHKVKRRGYSPARTLIVDDTPAKCIHNYGNAIYVREHKGQEDDSELLDLAKYLAALSSEPDVRKIEKRGWKNSPR